MPHFAAKYYASSAKEDSAVVKAGAGNLYGFSVYNDGGGVRYIQLFDATSLPANTAVPILSIRIADQTSENVNLPFGMRMGTGIVIALSSTDVTLTVATGSEALFNVRYSE